VPQPENPLWQYSWVAESLANDPEFIKAGFYNGRFIIATVDKHTMRTSKHSTQIWSISRLESM
jgi:hypothetical protein